LFPFARTFLSGVYRLARHADPENLRLHEFLKALSWNGGILPEVVRPVSFSYFF
jgi:hypothetical protein